MFKIILYLSIIILVIITICYCSDSNNIAIIGADYVYKYNEYLVTLSHDEDYWYISIFSLKGDLIAKYRVPDNYIYDDNGPYGGQINLPTYIKFSNFNLRNEIDINEIQYQRFPKEKTLFINSNLIYDLIIDLTLGLKSLEIYNIENLKSVVGTTDQLKDKFYTASFWKASCEGITEDRLSKCNLVKLYRYDKSALFALFYGNFLDHDQSYLQYKNICSLFYDDKYILINLYKLNLAKLIQKDLLPLRFYTSECVIFFYLIN